MASQKFARLEQISRDGITNRHESRGRESLSGERQAAVLSNEERRAGDGSVAGAAVASVWHQAENASDRVRRAKGLF